MRTRRFPVGDVDTRGPLPVFLFVLFFGFIGGRYTVDGVEHTCEMPVRSVPDGRGVGIEVLAADHAVVVSQPWLDVLVFRGGGIALAVLVIVSGVRWVRLARAATAELHRRALVEVHSNGSNPEVN